jgi:hypothetical protein
MAPTLEVCLRARKRARRNGPDFHSPGGHGRALEGMKPSVHAQIATVVTRNRAFNIAYIGLNRYAVAEADIPIKTCQSASTLPRHM